MENKDNWDDAKPWHPITNQLDLKHLGKLGEEACELGAALFRTIIQGIDELDPDTGKSNRSQVSDEIADVKANMELVIGHLRLATSEIEARSQRKIAHLKGWHAEADETPALRGALIELVVLGRGSAPGDLVDAILVKLGKKIDAA